MSINGIANSGILRTPAQLPVRDGGSTRRTRESGIGQAPATATPNAAQDAAAASANGLPVEPPAGTDPNLWSVLSSEERRYFAKVGAMGPLTYGRVMHESRTAPLAASRGGRLDVKI